MEIKRKCATFSRYTRPLGNHMNSENLCDFLGMIKITLLMIA